METEQNAISTPTPEETPAQVCARIAGMLVASSVQPLAEQLAQGCFTSYGLKSTALPADFCARLETVPAVPLVRWWALLRLTDAFAPRVADAFDWDVVFLERLEALDHWFCCGMPATRNELKHRLQTPLPVEPETAFAAYAALSDAFTTLPAEYAALLESGEPFRPQDLRITDAELLCEGVPQYKLDTVRQCLLQAVLDAPALNVWTTLAQMAHKLRWIA